MFVSRSCEITLEQVRLLLYKECDRRGRKVLFDSSTIEKVPSRKDDKPELRSSGIPSIVEVADGYTYIVSIFLFMFVLYFTNLY